MARISRLVASGYPHHVTQHGVRSIPIFDDDGDRIAYLGFMAEELKRFSVEVLAWCLMTNHTHLIVVPSDAGLLERGIRGDAGKRNGTCSGAAKSGAPNQARILKHWYCVPGIAPNI